MRLRELNIGCFGGGTGLPSLLGGLKRNPWLRLNAVVTMFDSGGSSGQLRDELGVLPPGDVLQCALALARNEGEARRVLLARLPTLEHDRLGGHTGGNLLLSMMEQLQRRLPRRRRRPARAARLPRPRVAGQRRAGDRSAPSTPTATTRRSRKSTRAVARHQVRKRVARADGADPSRGRRGDPRLRRRHHRSRQLLHQPDADAARRGVKEALAQTCAGRSSDRQPADRRARHDRLSPRPTRRAGSSEAIGRPVDVVIANDGAPVG